MRLRRTTQIASMAMKETQRTEIPAATAWSWTRKKRKLRNPLTSGSISLIWRLTSLKSSKATGNSRNSSVLSYHAKVEAAMRGNQPLVRRAGEGYASRILHAHQKLLNGHLHGGVVEVLLVERCS